MLDKDYKIPERGKPSIFVGERQSSALGLLKKSSSSGVINESLRKLRGLVTHRWCIITYIIQPPVDRARDILILTVE